MRDAEVKTGHLTNTQGSGIICGNLLASLATTGVIWN
jgi:hypothetical protein